MKKQYMKPAMLVEVAQASQLLTTSTDSLKIQDNTWDPEIDDYDELE